MRQCVERTGLDQSHKKHGLQTLALASQFTLLPYVSIKATGSEGDARIVSLDVWIYGCCTR